jgi:hypothetical protein
MDSTVSATAGERLGDRLLMPLPLRNVLRYAAKAKNPEETAK